MPLAERVPPSNVLGIKGTDIKVPDAMLEKEVNSFYEIKIYASNGMNLWSLLAKFLISEVT